MGSIGDARGVRLAELMAALSLGIDLGFAQPMEHVVRQTSIALRIAERLGLDAEQRSVVYYAALLTNVGCHTDAHEQAKWFGDDIALKGDKYAYGLHGVRSAVAGLRRLGAGHPALHRFRIGLDYALSGHRELDGMVARHSEMAQSLAAAVGLPVPVQVAAEAVLVAAGHRTVARRARPAALTAREVDVLRLVARGLSSKEVAMELVISPKTARNHIEHIYAKTGVTNRVAASIFATKHGLLDTPSA